MPDLIGQTLGRYLLVELLGEGGMAAVYRAHDTQLQRDVAIKVILPQHQHSEKFLKRFEREARSMAGLNHPNIVRVLDYGKQGGIIYLVLEYLPGGTLKDRMRQPIPWGEAAQLIIPIAQALAYMHRRDIIHRDIKPANILFDERGQPMLSDFGIAKMLDDKSSNELTGTGMGIGTPAYMAPEQGLGITDFRVDVYALGMVFYEMITAHRPYVADTPMSIMLKKMNEPLTPPSQLVRGLPREVDATILHALASDPNQRYQGMEELIAALRSLVPEETARPPAPAPKLPIACLGIGAAALLALICMLGGFFLLKDVRFPAFSLPTSTLAPTSSATFAPTLTFTPESTSIPESTSTPEPTATSAPVYVREINPSDGAAMIHIPQGDFTMGSDEKTDPYFWGAEKPIHRVYLKTFYIYVTEVTNVMYQACVDAKACRRPELPRSRQRKSYFGNTQFSTYPVLYVTWQDAANYCKWAKARLPSEAEWEKSARGDDARLFPWGSNGDDAIGRAAFGHGDTEAVGSYPEGASPYGVLDMAGNALEWVNDNYAIEYYNQSPLENPLGPDFGTRKGIRGGSWSSLVDGLRTSARASLKPDEAVDTVGFRCALDAP